MLIRRTQGSVAMLLFPSQVLITTSAFLLVAIATINGRDTATLNCLALECEYKCRPSPIGGECFCPEEKQIANDSKTCIDRNKCAEWGFCDQLCEKTDAKTYTCGCRAGYALRTDGRKCAANNRTGPSHVYFAHGGGVMRIDPTDGRTAVIVRDTVAGAVDYHYASNTLYWLDANRKTIVSARLPRSDSSTVGDEMPLTAAGVLRDPVAMAVDWVADKLYAVDGLGVRIVVVIELKAGRAPRSAVVLSAADLTDPSDIALDPTRGYAFVADGRRLIRANMDGTGGVRAIVTEDVSKASGVSVDIVGRRVYWCDTALNRVETADYEGNGRRTVFGGPDAESSPSRLAVFENTVYWSDGGKLQGVLAVDKYDPATVSPLYRSADVKGAKSVKIVHSLVQRKVSSLCSTNNGGCYHMCITSRSGNGSLTYRCACSTGYQLANDQRNCVVVDEFLLYSQQGFVKGKILNDTRQGFIDNAMQPITEESARFVGLDFDARDGYIYYSDDLQDVIYRTRRNGTGKEMVFESQNDGMEGIAVDWVAKNLYYVGSKSGTINVLSTRNVTNRSVLLRNMKKPKAIAVHPNKGFIFFTEWNRPISIIRAYTDGSNSMAFPDITLGWPNGLAVDYEANRLYWCDALLDHVQHSDLDGTDVKTIDTAMIRHPTSIVTAHRDWLYITDGRMNAIVKMHKLTGLGSEARVREPQKTYGVKVYGEREQPVDRSHPCTVGADRGGCQKLCFGIPSGASMKLQVQCGCPTGEKIHSDGKTCVTDDLDTDSASVDEFFE